MLATKRISLETVDFRDDAQVDAFYEQIIAEGMARVRAETAELQAKGVLDSEGRLIDSELPEDMRPDSGLDFGG